MTLDALMRESLARSGAPLRRPASGRLAAKEALSPPILAWCLALALAGACRGEVPGGVAASGGGSGNGSGGSITLAPLGDVHIGPQDDFDPASLRRTYVLDNRTHAPLSWEALVSEPWLALVGAKDGVLAPGESVEVPLHVDPYAASQAGVWVASFQVTSSTSPRARPRGGNSRPP